MTDNQQVLRELVATLVRLAEQLAAGTGAVPLVNEQPPPEMCVSCNDLRCVLRWKSFAEAPVEDVDVRAFLLGHGLIRGYSCDLHGDSRMIDRGEYWECIHLVTPTQQCRRRQSKALAAVGSKQQSRCQGSVPLLVACSQQRRTIFHCSNCRCSSEHMSAVVRSSWFRVPSSYCSRHPPFQSM